MADDTLSKDELEVQAKAHAEKWRPAVWIVFGVAVFFWSGIFNQQLRLSTPVVRWFATMVIMLMLLAFAGLEINGRLLGFLIDSRYKFSLSRLQITLWTIITLSAYLTIALPRTLSNGLEPIATNTGQATDAEQKAAAQLQQDCLQRLTANAQAAGTPVDEKAIGAEAATVCTTADPLNITFPPELIAALGISAASFAGSSLIQSSKKSKQIDVRALNSSADALQTQVDNLQKVYNDKKVVLDQRLREADEQKKIVEGLKKQIEEDPNKKTELAATLSIAQSLLDSREAASKQASTDLATPEKDLADAKAKLEEERKTVDEKLTSAEGLLHKNSDPSKARLSDLFRAEEIGVNYKLLDMSKVQMFFFTIVVVFAYSVALYSLLQNSAALRHPLWVDFPAFSATLNTLLAISHAGYLSVKTADRTPSAN